MKKELDEVLIAPRSPRFGVFLMLLGGAAILTQSLFLYVGFSTGTEYFDVVTKFGGAFLIFLGGVEILRRRHRFALTAEGFDDRVFGGIGVVAWEEVRRFRVVRSS